MSVCVGVCVSGYVCMSICVCVCVCVCVGLCVSVGYFTYNKAWAQLFNVTPDECSARKVHIKTQPEIRPTKNTFSTVNSLGSRLKLSDGTAS